MPLSKIVSVGRTDVERAVLDAALAGSSHRQRTLENVWDSDGTQMFFHRALTGGTKSALRLVAENEISVTNMAGPRATGWEEGYEITEALIGGAIRGSVPT